MDWLQVCYMKYVRQLHIQAHTLHTVVGLGKYDAVATKGDQDSQSGLPLLTPDDHLVDDQDTRTPCMRQVSLHIAALLCWCPTQNTKTCRHLNMLKLRWAWWESLLNCLSSDSISVGMVHRYDLCTVHLLLGLSMHHGGKILCGASHICTAVLRCMHHNDGRKHACLAICLAALILLVSLARHGMANFIRLLLLPCH